MDKQQKKSKEYVQTVQRANKLKAEIYRLRYEHTKLDQAKSLLNSQ